MPIRQTDQKIIWDKLVTDRQQTDRQTDIFELNLIHLGEKKLCMGGRERIG
jgi:hypothetical protein